MLNLLNREKRYFIRREYLGRLTNVFLSILIFCGVYYGILIFSNSFLVGFEKQVVESESNNTSFTSLQKELEEYENILKHIEEEYNLFSKEIIYPTEVISDIENKKNEGIELSSITFQKLNNEEGATLEIKGVAENRDNLINYSNSFKQDEKFKDVTTPISSLAKNTDISFSISLKIN